MTLIDMLLLGPSEVTLIVSRYPDCRITRVTNSDDDIQQYRLLLKTDDKESYYNFLLDNCIAMSSHLFYERVKNDGKFADRMKARIADAE